MRMTPGEMTAATGKDAAHVDEREDAQWQIFFALVKSALRLAPRPS